MYPFKYPELYAEAARQGVSRKELANAISITVAGLRYKQNLNTDGDFEGDEMRKLSVRLGKPVQALFRLDESA